MFVPADGGESDIGQLFSGVTGQKETPGKSIPAPLDETGPGVTSPSIDSMPMRTVANDAKVESRRPVLTLIDVATDRKPIGPWRLRSGQPRPIGEVTSLFEGQSVDLVEIADPYALADRGARHAQVEFVRALRSSASSIKRVTIFYRPPFHDDEEDESSQRRDIGSLWCALLGADAAKIPLTLQARRRTQEQDFHDRWVTVSCVNPRGMQTKHELQFSRGLIGLMNDRFECLITYLP
jgi:hypothetical protein